MKKQRCQICYRQYVRQKCEFCARSKKWDDVILDKRLNVFPIRIKTMFDKEKLKETKLSKSNWYLVGTVGTGKTLKAARIILRRVKDDYIRGIYSSIGFYNVPELLMRLRDTFSEGGVETEKSIFKEVSNWDYLILDDIGSEKSSDWALQTLYIIINHRYEDMKQTIITSNYDFNELQKHLKSERLVSRLREMCILFNARGSELRK